uniref:Uncharacterized protein n=1 Tax=Acrobeloides nanus TaxID=290746 RepID=A0A914DD24_9BILA
MQKSSIFSKFTCPDKKAEKISSPNEQAISSHLANTKQYEETKLQLEEALKENAELRQEVLLLNETMTALPLRLEADLVNFLRLSNGNCSQLPKQAIGKQTNFNC